MNIEKCHVDTLGNINTGLGKMRVRERIFSYENFLKSIHCVFYFYCLLPESSCLTIKILLEMCQHKVPVKLFLNSQSISQHFSKQLVYC